MGIKVETQRGAFGTYAHITDGARSSMIQIQDGMTIERAIQAIADQRNDPEAVSAAADQIKAHFAAQRT